MKTIKDLDIHGKKILLRADYNVPVLNGEISDDYRIKKSLPTLQYLLEQDCSLVIISHLGRPKDSSDQQFSLRPVAKRLQELLDVDVAFAQKLEDVSDQNKVTLCENLRFNPGEERNDPRFAKQLAALGEVFVQDGFGVVHRAHASTEAVTKFLPSVAGLLLEEEVVNIIQAMNNPTRPLVAIMGGAKVSDKIELIYQLVAKADRIVVGGAMANTFLKYHGFEIGKSKYEEGQEKTIEQIYQAVTDKGGAPDQFIWLPKQYVYVGKSLNPAEKSQRVETSKVKPEEQILDNYLSEDILSDIKTAGTVIWNGPVGMIELPEFTQGSHKIAAAIKDSQSKSIVGGGDTAAFVEKNGLIDDFDWVSTGGGAALDLMAGKELPGVAALEN